MDGLAFLRRHGDQLIAIALVAGIIVESFAAGRDPDEPIGSGEMRAMIALLTGLALAAATAWRRRAPLVVLGVAIAAALGAVTAPIDAPVCVVIALMMATYSAGAHTDERQAPLALIGVAAVVLIAIAKDLGADAEPSDVALPILAFGAPWLAGWSIRSRREREVALERVRAGLAERAVAEERARIARELHDAVAHSIGVVVLQARGARRTITSDPAVAVEAIDAIERTAATALTEMRRMVGVLREDDADRRLAPPPSMRHIEALVAQVRDAGMPVELSIEGQPVDLAPGIDGSAYRIVQEALTNTLTHADATAARVRVSYEVDRLALEIVDTGVGPGRPAGDEPPGHGLLGMRERVALYGGRLEAGAAPGGGYRILASLPIETAAG